MTNSSRSTPISLDRLVAQLQERPFAPVPLAFSAEVLEQGARDFLNFIALPDKVKDTLSLRHIPGMHPGYRIGYERRKRQKDGARDSKEFVHYTPEMSELLKDEIAQLPADLGIFLKTAEKIFRGAEATMWQVLTAFDEKFPGFSAQFKAPGSYGLLRFLKYDRLKPGDFLAVGHYDRGGCTLALAESAPGLRIGFNDTDLAPVHRDRDQALFMPALFFENLTGGMVKPAWHDVIQRSADTVNDEIARWAIVFFIDPAGTPAYTAVDAHTPKR
jgi:isopenicillin N synthase-like dioxygenase